MQLIAMWLLRRVLELGGTAGALLAFWNGLSPDVQAAILMLLGSNWESITLGSIIPIAVAIGGYAWSWISTMRSQVVVDGKRIHMNEIPAGKNVLVEEIARTAMGEKKQTLIERLFAMKR